jgi:hypothetical protein
MNAALPLHGATGADDQRPWIGLASFTEESRQYFHGREEEIAELARRVQRRLLTVLFGQSGLGKTSILRAGLVPRLRGQGYCPVYVRIDYAADAPEPAEQIKRAIFEAARGAGQWTQAGAATQGETLWEFLHHRDDLLRDAQGQTLIPLLIFDQFEEVFTLAQSDEAGRARAARFLAQLADLVENRPPASFEARLEADDALAERFDFARSDYRVLIALREDYLAQLEGLKGAMPSITQNRLRLAPMNGRQALQAVLRPGGNLVTPEVAEAIVRFVAGGAEIGNAEVEPSLLSLICRELNDARIARGDTAISLDLLAGSHEEILSNFYERALADQPPQVRRIIEDDLLTDSGFRENIAEERLRRSLDAAGAAPGTLATLVDRRLLRIEERLDLRRVELTHDVLCGVVKASRDVRHEREAREAVERQLAEQHAREQASRAALHRARRVAAICGALAVIAIAAAAYAWYSSQRAQRAERLAQQSRTQAEALLGYLTDDFAEELSRTGRLEVVAALARREVTYFHALPADLRGPDSRRLGALALVQLGRALRSQGNLDEANAAINEALDLLEQLRREGDESDETLVALSRALGARARIYNSRQHPDSLAVAEQSVAVIAPRAAMPDAPEPVRKAHVEQLVSLGFQYNSADTTPDRALQALDSARAIAERHGGKDPRRNLYMAERYAEASAWTMNALNSVGRSVEAIAVGQDAGKLAEEILQVRPGDFPALYSLGLIEGYLGAAAWDDLRPADALPSYRRATEVYTTITQLDPGNRIYANNRGSQFWELSFALWAIGRQQESGAALEVAIAEMQRAAAGGPRLSLSGLYTVRDRVEQLAQQGDFDRAEALLQQQNAAAMAIKAGVPAGDLIGVFAQSVAAATAAGLADARGDWSEALRLAGQAAALVRNLQASPGEQQNWKTGMLAFAASEAAPAAMQLGDYKAAEQWAREGLEANEHSANSTVARGINAAAHNSLLARALVAQGRSEEAREAIAPSVAFMRDLQKRNRQDLMLKVDIARTLRAQALADPDQRAALLREAAAMLDALPPQIRELVDVRRLRDQIGAAAST